jgi:hypothetical protein
LYIRVVVFMRFNTYTVTRKLYGVFVRSGAPASVGGIVSLLVVLLRY